MGNYLNLEHGLGKNSAVPHILARTGVFSSQIYRGPTKRPIATLPFKLHTFGDSTASQTAGQRLDQSDADVFYELIRTLFSRDTSIDPLLPFEIEPQALLAAMKRKKGGKTNALLDTSLRRLSQAKFEVNEKSGRKYNFGIVTMSAAPTTCSNSIFISMEIDPQLLRLYTSDGWTLLLKSERNKLRLPISKALYAYYRTHRAQPHAHKATTIKNLVGRNGMDETKWRTQLRAALCELQSATGWATCELTDAGHVVVIKKCHTQQLSASEKSKKPPPSISDAYDI